MRNRMSGGVRGRRRKPPPTRSSTLKEMPSIALDKTTHRVYTNAWRQEMAYGTRYRDSAGFRWILYKCSNKVYKNSRILRMAARRIIYTRWY